MKILQISSDYFDTSVYYKLFSQLNKHISICTIVPVEKYVNEQFVTQSNNINIRTIFQGKPRIFGAQINSLKVAKEIVKSNILDDIDLIHSHYILNDGAIAMNIFKITGIPYVVSIRASCLLNFNRKLAIHNYITSMKVLNNAKLIYLQSYAALSTLLDNIPIIYRKSISNKVRVISNGIDDFWLNNKSHKSEKRISNKFNIITAASIEYNKNLIMVAELIDKLNLEGYQIKYFIAGKIKDLSIFNKLINFKCVVYLGELDKNDLMDYYRKSHIFVMLSHFETFGLVYAEALSQGLPIIYTLKQGFDGQFEEGMIGYHCSSKDSRELQNVIIKVLDNYENLIINTSTSISKFNWESIAIRYIEDYKSIYLKN